MRKRNFARNVVVAMFIKFSSRSKFRGRNISGLARVRSFNQSTNGVKRTTQFDRRRRIQIRQFVIGINKDEAGRQTSKITEKSVQIQRRQLQILSCLRITYTSINYIGKENYQLNSSERFFTPLIRHCVLITV